jgi:hypothetical protein
MSTPVRDASTLAHPEDAASPEGRALSALGRVLAAQDVGSMYDSAKRELRALFARDPIDALVVTCLGSAWLFYVAERDENPKVRSFADALVFVSTSFSVGYCDFVAVTSAGKAIASTLNAIGPSMASRALETPAAERAEAQREAIATQREAIDAQRALIARIDALVTSLEERTKPAP